MEEPQPRIHGAAGQAQGSRTRAREQAHAQAQRCGVGAAGPSMAPDILSYGRRPPLPSDLG